MATRTAIVIVIAMVTATMMAPTFRPPLSFGDNCQKGNQSWTKIQGWWQLPSKGNRICLKKQSQPITFELAAVLPMTRVLLRLCREAGGGGFYKTNPKATAKAGSTSRSYSRPPWPAGGFFASGRMPNCLGPSSSTRTGSPGRMPKTLHGRCGGVIAIAIASLLRAAPIPTPPPPPPPAIRIAAPLPA